MKKLIIDKMLNELNENQLNRKSMSCIKGGYDGVEQWSVLTKTGLLVERYDPSTGCYNWRLNNNPYLPHELGTNDRTPR